MIDEVTGLFTQNVRNYKIFNLMKYLFKSYFSKKLEIHIISFFTISFFALHLQKHYVTIKRMFLMLNLCFNNFQGSVLEFKSHCRIQSFVYRFRIKRNRKKNYKLIKKNSINK